MLILKKEGDFTEKVVKLESSANLDEENSSAITSTEEAKRQNFEIAINRIINKAYILGVSNGVRAAFIDILLEINKDKNMNTATKLLRIKKMCEKRIDELKSKESNENETKKDGVNNGT